MQPNLCHCISYCFSSSGVSLSRVGRLSWPNGYVPWCLHLGPAPSTQPCHGSSSLALGYSIWGRYMNLLLGIFPSSYRKPGYQKKKQSSIPKITPKDAEDASTFPLRLQPQPCPPHFFRPRMLRKRLQLSCSRIHCCGPCAASSSSSTLPTAFHSHTTTSSTRKETAVHQWDDKLPRAPCQWFERGGI